jgi:hypothetical protein
MVYGSNVARICMKQKTAMAVCATILYGVYYTAVPKIQAQQWLKHLTLFLIRFSQLCI